MMLQFEEYALASNNVLQESYQVAFRRKIYCSLEELQIDLDIWLAPQEILLPVSPFIGICLPFTINRGLFIQLAARLELMWIWI
jgi:hypothetical protein